MNVLGIRKRVLDGLVKVELLIIDDWFLTSPTREQVQQLHILVDRRYRTVLPLFTAPNYHRGNGISG